VSWLLKAQSRSMPFIEMTRSLPSTTTVAMRASFW
jgi:hypothetical protein